MLVGLDGRVRVTDFGLARSPAPPLGAVPPAAPLSPADAVVGASGDSLGVAGTPRYMAPEQRAGASADARSDQFSFAVALHEAVCGEHPFPTTDARTHLAAIQRGAVRPPPPRRRVPGWLRRVLQRALSPEPARRFASMDALCDALERGRLRRTRILLGVAAAAVAAALGAALRPDHVLEVCEPADVELAGILDEPRRRALQEVAEAADPALWPAMAGQLELVRATWSERHDAACAATSASDGLDTFQDSGALLECLGRTRELIRVATDMSLRSEPVALSFIARGRLADFVLPRCTSPETADDFPPLPDDEATRTHLLETQIHLDDVHRLETEGRFAEARERVGQLLGQAEAEASGSHQLLAEVTLRLGVLEQRLGDPKSAQKTLERALAFAETGRYDRLLPEIWLALVDADVSLGRLAEASRGIDRAAAFLTRLRGSPATMARMHSKRAMVLRALARHREAIELEEQALALSRSTPRSELLVAASLTLLSLSHLALGHDDRALELNRQALALREQVLGPEHTRVAGSLNNIGEALLGLGDTDGARPYLLRALAIREKSLGPEGLEVSNVLVNLAELARVTGRPQEAREHLERALAIRERYVGRQHPSVAEVLHPLGALKLAEHDVTAAILLLERARTIFERAVGAGHPSTALVCVTLGRAELARGAPMAARPILEAAFEILDEADIRPDERAEAAFALARALAVDPAEQARARRLAESARDLYADLGSPVERQLGEVQAWLTGPAPD